MEPVDRTWTHTPCKLSSLLLHTKYLFSFISRFQRPPLMVCEMFSMLPFKCDQIRMWLLVYNPLLHQKEICVTYDTFGEWVAYTVECVSKKIKKDNCICNHMLHIDMKKSKTAIVIVKIVAKNYESKKYKEKVIKAHKYILLFDIWLRQKPNMCIAMNTHLTYPRTCKTSPMHICSQSCRNQIRSQFQETFTSSTSLWDWLYIWCFWMVCHFWPSYLGNSMSSWSYHLMWLQNHTVL